MSPRPFAFVLVVVSGCLAGPSTPSSWRLVYQNDLDGKTLSGSKEALAKALKRGSPIRVAWGEKLKDGTSVVEFAVPDFVSLMNDQDVVVQFPGHVIQTSYLDPSTAELRVPNPTVWRAMMASNGRYHQFHYDLKTGEITRVMSARTNASWYALVPDDDRRAAPELALPDTFRLESSTKK